MSVQQSEPWIDTGLDGDVDDLYHYSREATGVANFDAVTDDAYRQFAEQGYLVIEEAFTPAEVEGALAGLLDVIDGKYPEFAGIQFEAKARDLLPTLAPEAKQDVVRKLIAFVEYEPRLAAIAHHPKLLAMLARMIGETPTLYQDQAMLKPPFIGREKPWHQDSAFFDLPLDSTIVGVWIALDEALPENGCMHIIPGSQSAGPVLHFQRRDWQLCDTDVAVNEVVAVPLKPGGLLFFHSLLHHGTPPSHSAKRRRALQFHYKPASLERTDPEVRLAVFGSDGKDVTC